jgi:hypothetical protein
LGIKPKAARVKGFEGVTMETAIYDSASLEVVDKVKPGAAYGHIVTIGRYEALWALPLKIKSSLPDMKQLFFRMGGKDTSESEWDITLHANRVGGEQRQLLICAGEKVRKKDTVTVLFTGHTHEEIVPLEVKIE